jgi:hypothetical protein
VTFQSALVPPYVRETRFLEAALPWLYFKGISTGEMQEALSVLVGPEAKGLSPGVIRRFKESWIQEYLLSGKPVGWTRTAGFTSGRTESTAEFGPVRTICVLS